MTPLTREPFASWSAAYDRAKAMCETAAYIGREPDWPDIDKAGALNATERSEIRRAAVARVAAKAAGAP